MLTTTVDQKEVFEKDRAARERHSRRRRYKQFRFFFFKMTGGTQD
jgi:hypothetical protein